MLGNNLPVMANPNFGSLEVRGSNIPDGKNIVWKDDFLGDSLDAKYYAYTAGSSTVGVVDNIPGGAVRIDTASGEDNQAFFQLGSGSFETLDPRNQFEIITRFRIDYVDRAETTIGWYQGSSHYCLFRMSSTDGKLYTIGKGGTAEDSDYVDSGVVLTANTWTWLKMAVQSDLSVVFSYSLSVDPTDNWTAIRTSSAGLLYASGLTGAHQTSVNDASAVQTKLDTDYLEIRAIRF